MKNELIRFSDSLLDNETGCYFRGHKVSDTELEKEFISKMNTNDAFGDNNDVTYD